jgi:hypothetical protein
LLLAARELAASGLVPGAMHLHISASHTSPDTPVDGLAGAAYWFLIVGFVVVAVSDVVFD